jgi:UDP-4-amino-4,6-dideoxy-L-N-acetyl-beta-L-altrosamine transaminase
MIKLMHVNDYVIDTSQFSPLLNDKIVEELEQKIASYVGAKYACSIHSATMAIFMSLIEKEKQIITIPSIIPPVVPNAILTAGHYVNYKDDVDWVGASYILHDFGDYKIIDSAQQLDKDQYKNQANDDDLMIFSFYPTKPVGSIDGGMVVSNDKNKIDRIKTLSRYGTNFEDNSWERKFILPGWKMYMNSVQAYVALQNFYKLEDKSKRFDEIREIYNNEFDLSNTSRHLYRMRVKNRDSFIEKMKEIGIQCGIHYRSVHSTECYKPKTETKLFLSEIESSTTVSIPFHEMLTEEEISKVIQGVKKCLV